MMKKIFALSLILSVCITGQAKSLNTTIVKDYTAANGNIIPLRIEFNSNGVHPYLNGIFGGDYNYIEVDEEGNTVYNGFYYEGRETFIVNGKGEILARKPSWSANIDETYQYTDTGKALRYNMQGELLGAYKDSANAFIAARGWSVKTLTDENGTFYDKDENGNIHGIYYADGSVDEYKYDSGGNLTAVYEKGIATYKRTSYTPKEAAAAANKGNNNTITFTFK